MKTSAMHNDKSPVSNKLASSFESMSLLEMLPDPVIFLDAAENILYANARAASVVGAQKYELRGKTLLQGAPHFVTTILYRALGKAKQAHIPFQVEYFSLITQTWLRVYLSPTNEGIVLFFHEETEPTQFQDSLYLSERTEFELLERISERVAILTPEGLLLEINQPPLADAQVRREEVIGKPLTLFPSWAAAPLAQAQLRSAIAQASKGAIVHFEARIRPLKGGHIDLAVTVTPHPNRNQQVEYLTCTARDITERKQAEEELHSLTETLPQFVWTARRDGSVTYNNRHLIDYMAMTLEQVQGNGWMACVHPDDRQRVRYEWQTSIRTGLPYEVEHRMQEGISGVYRWFLVRGVPQRDAEGVIQSWIGTCTDIDEQKQAEERTRASEQNLHVLAETVPHLVWATQPDGRLDYTNQRYLDLVHADFEHIQDYGWRQFIHPEDLERTLALRQRSLSTGELYESEYRVKDGHTGEYRWFLARALPVRDETGQIIRWFGTGTDIDEKKRTEAALRQSQQRVQALMTSNILGIFIAQKEEILEANDTFLHMTGYSWEDLQNHQLNWMHMTAPEYLTITQQAHHQLKLQDYLPAYEKEYICKDGSRLPVLVGGVKTQLDPLQTICFVLDNSARKELEQRKDVFLSMASHELKTPLTSLKLQTQMLRKQVTRQDLQRADAALSRMEGQLNTITRLVEELFDLSKIQAGKLEYTQETVNLNELLQETVEVVQQTQTTHTIVIQSPPSPVLMIGDRDRLGQVFLNLITNAIKYSPDANQVEVDMVSSPERLLIRVRDHGIGIPREQHEKIFERFYRAVPQQQRAFTGLGMGLSIACEIVKHYGGTITVESEMGAGSTFQVMLPHPTL